MQATHRITITDLKTGAPLVLDGMRAEFETRFGLVCTLVSSDDGGTAFAHALIGSKFTVRDFHGMALAVLQNLGRVARQAADDPEEYDHLISAITGAFQKWLVDELEKPGAALLLHGMSLLAAGVDPVPEEEEP